MRRIWIFAAVLTVSFASTTVWAANVSNRQIHELLVANECLRARSAVDSADNRQDFLSPPYGRMLYGGSVCCSRVEGLTRDDISGAEAYLRGARGSLGPDSKAWIDSLLATCERTRTAVGERTQSDRDLLKLRMNRILVESKIVHKALGGCGNREDRNISPLVATKKRSDVPMAWIVPRADGATLPPNGYIEELSATHVGPSPKSAVCSPFVAISGSQNPAKVCTAAHRFLNFFEAAYGALRPPVWIALHYYSPDREYVLEHAQAAGELIDCRGVLGYFDWQRQAIIWRSPTGFFGTFNHELAHALMFWDAPLLPRWFDEGVAGLYENSMLTSSGGYHGIENPWRQEVLRTHGKLPVTRDMMERVMRMAPLDFEADSLHSTIAREAMRRFQDCGKLATIYTAMREESRRSGTAADAQRPISESYPDARIAAWQAIVGRKAGETPCW